MLLTGPASRGTDAESHGNGRLGFLPELSPGTQLDARIGAAGRDNRPGPGKLTAGTSTNSNHKPNS